MSIRKHFLLDEVRDKRLTAAAESSGVTETEVLKRALDAYLGIEGIELAYAALFDVIGIADQDTDQRSREENR